jgi:acetyl-CoA synthetase
VDFAYGFDIREDDVIAWISDLGWILGPLMIVGGLQLGATMVFTEGVPDYPTSGRLWEIMRRHNVTRQGIAPTAARLMMTQGADAPEVPDSLQAFISTGEAWDLPTWHWLFNQAGRRRAPIINYSGGTEVGGGILVSYPFLPMDAGAFNGPLPGMDVAVMGSEGLPVTGEIGELVVLNTWPGMTHGFWQDRERYLETYWGRWDGVWLHGDLASVEASGAWHIHGRSDDTIKVSGRRVGPAELETALLQDSRIAQAAVIGVPDPQRGQTVVAFVTLRKDQSPPAHEDLRATAERHIGRSFAPKLHIVPSLPSTKNGKIMRRLIRAQHLGQPLGDLTALDPSTPIDAIPRRHPVDG